MDFIKALEEFDEPIPRRKETNWENLAKELENALTDEIAENDKLKKEVDILRMESDAIVEHHKYLRNVIFYLESKLGYNQV